MRRRFWAFVYDVTPVGSRLNRFAWRHWDDAVGCGCWRHLLSKPGGTQALWGHCRCGLELYFDNRTLRCSSCHEQPSHCAQSTNPLCYEKATEGAVA